MYLKPIKLMKKTFFYFVACFFSFCYISAQNTEISYVDLDIEDLMKVRIHEVIKTKTTISEMNFTNQEIHERRIQNLYEVIAIYLRTHNLPQDHSSIKLSIYNNHVLADKEFKNYLYYCIDDVDNIKVDWLASNNTATIYVTH